MLQKNVIRAYPKPTNVGWPTKHFNDIAKLLLNHIKTNTYRPRDQQLSDFISEVAESIVIYSHGPRLSEVATYNTISTTLHVGSQGCNQQVKSCKWNWKFIHGWTVNYSYNLLSILRKLKLLAVADL